MLQLPIVDVPMTQSDCVSVDESELLPPQADNVRNIKKRSVFSVAEIFQLLISIANFPSAFRVNHTPL